jgi:cysteine-S-conjugate beta-lyase
MNTKRAFDFDTPVDRLDASSSKWEKYRGRDIIPMWVADMDFRTAPCIVDMLAARVQHGVFGYTNPPAELPGAVAAAMRRDHGWQIDPDWIVWMPSLVVGLNVVSRAFAAENEEILTATPIYPPFLSAPENGNRRAIRVPMRESDDGWRWDLDALEAAVTPRTRVLLLCSPHNPSGRVWTREELSALAAFCERHDLVLVSDEIHAGLVLDQDAVHLPAAMLGEAVAARTVTLQSTSKTFNMPGLGCAFAIASDADLRARLRRTMAGIVHHVGALGYFATLAAYRDGRDWQLALLDYLRGNRDRVAQAIADMPGLKTRPVEATYLAWLDARELPVDDPLAFFEAAGVGLYDGALFGAPGFLRLNFACPRALLDQALARMADAVRAL